MRAGIAACLALSVVLASCSHDQKGDATGSSADRRVCELMLAPGYPDRPALGAAADPSTEIGRAAVIAADPNQEIRDVYPLDSKLEQLCVAAGY